MEKVEQNIVICQWRADQLFAAAEGWAKYRDLRDTDKSWYFAITKFKDCFVIQSPNLSSYFNHFLAAQGIKFSAIYISRTWFQLHMSRIFAAKHIYTVLRMSRPTGFFCRSQVTGHIKGAQFTGHRSQVTGHIKIKKAISNTGDARITRDSQEVYRYFHATYISLVNFNEKFLGVIYVLTGLKYSFHTCSVTYILSL